ncbi:MAG: AmmeMemoRadiSam system protein B [Deltaproteobacteria bacterium]|jgi:AmmeMemoRadiSam system protein B|nr:AmmeMemoRadiSam system protein B [Deltaproteobacteria bacterium]
MNIRQPVVSGRFYTADPQTLRTEVQGYLDQGADFRAECADMDILGCMVPHAGYIFSGGVAGLTLSQARLPESVLLLGPNHTGLGPALSLWPDGAWSTPLGDVPVDSDGVDWLLGWRASDEKSGGSLFTADRTAHLREHSLEVLLPFLQLQRSTLSIIPLCVREYNPERLKEAGLAVAALVRSRQERGKALLLITSSDMSHYLPHEEGRKQDLLALEQILDLSPEGLFQVCVRKKISMCGFAAMTIMLHACKVLGATRCRLTAHTSSGVTGKKYGADMKSVVGYAGALIA